MQLDTGCFCFTLSPLVQCLIIIVTHLSEPISALNKKHPLIIGLYLSDGWII